MRGATALRRPATRTHVDRVRDAYLTCHTRLWRALLAFSGSGDVADEALAEAFAQVLARGDAIKNVEAWVWRASFAIARGQLSARPGDHDVGGKENQTADLQDEATDLIRALARLDYRDREVLILCDYAGWRAAEVARMADLPAVTVRVRLHRARKRARQLLEREELL